MFTPSRGGGGPVDGTGAADSLALSMIECVPFELGLVMVFIPGNQWLPNRTDCNGRFSVSAFPFWR